MTDDKLPPSLSRFGAELQRAIARELGSDQEPQTSSSRRRRPRLIAGTTLAAAAVAAVIVLVVGATTSSPAYAVSQNRDGTVTVRVQQLAAVGGLNERLRTLHVPARVVAVAAACGQLMYREISPSIHANVSATRFDPRAIPHGQTLLLASWLAGHQVQVAIARQVAGRTPACLAHRMARQLAISVHSANNPPIVWTCGFRAPVPAGSDTGGNSGTGNSGTGNSGNSGTGNSGNSGTGNSGNSGTGNSGNSGTGNSGTTSNSGPPPTQVPLPTASLPRTAQKATLLGPAAALAASRPIVMMTVHACQSPPPGNSGNSGNSRNSGAGNSGNSGTGNSGSSSSSSTGNS